MKNKVILILAIVAIGALIFVIFAPKRSNSTIITPDKKEYEKSIRILNDTIEELRGDIAKFETEMTFIELERKVLRQQLNELLKEYEKKNSAIADGNWDYNIKFLSDYLSEIDSGRE